MNVPTLDLTIVSEYEKTNIEQIIERLKADDKYKPNLLYSGTSEEKLEELIDPIISPNPSFYVYNERDLKNPILNSPFEYADDHDNPVIVMFNPQHVKQVFTDEHKFKEPIKRKDSIVAVYKLIIP